MSDPRERLNLTEGNRGHTPYGAFCRVHIRAHMPPPALRASRFICTRCDRWVDPTCEAWTSHEYHLGGRKGR